MTRTPKHLNEHAALNLLRQPDHSLVLMHTKVGQEFFVMPGGPVTKEVALKIIERVDVQPHDNGLLDGHPQSWKLGPWR
jgi:hypothetical protein